MFDSRVHQPITSGDSMNTFFPKFLAAGALVAAVAFAPSALAETVGVTDKEIVIGATAALSGPASAYGAVARSAAGYFKMVNEQGGINGRQIKFLVRDDGYSPPRTVEQTRKLVEQDKVAFIATPQGSLTSLTVRSYLNENKVPQLFVAATAGALNDPKNFPWTTGSMPNGDVEARAIAQHILKTAPTAKIAMLIQNDDAGREYSRALLEVLGAERIKQQATFEHSDPSVDSQILTLATSKAEVLIIGGAPKPTAQALRKAYDSGWKPQQTYIINAASSVEHVLTPAGLDKVKGVISTAFLKDSSDPQWANDPAIKAWVANMSKYNPGMTLDIPSRMGWINAEMVAQVIKQSGKDLSRENIMRQAANLKMESGLLLPGLTIATSPTNFAPIPSLRIQQFDGTRWNLLP
jgi:ABC-type branched-subunit amino acid transport system substrate-binding protein